MPRWGWFVLALGLGLSMAAAFPACREFWQVDACLDRGGSWNELKQACEF